MRRFELSEGTSNKFWSISLDGTSFTVQWGKIGTAGQSQTKTFPTDAKAKAEHDKLVSEKLKKGYGEVGGAKPAPARAQPANAQPANAQPANAEPANAQPAKPAAAQPALSAAPSEAPPVAAKTAAPPSPTVAGDGDAPDGTLAWTPDVVARIAPRRDGRVPPQPVTVDPKKAWAAVLAQIEKIRPQIRAGKKVGGSEREVMDALDEHLDADAKTPPQPAGADVEGAIQRLLQLSGGYRITTPAERHVDYLVAMGGHALATDALIRSLGWTQSEKAQKSFALVRAPADHWAGVSHGRPGTFAVLRAHLASAPEAAYSEARDVAAKARKAGAKLSADPLHVRVATSYLFPTERGWVAEDLKSSAPSTRPGNRGPVLLLLYSARDAAELETLIGQRTPYELIGGDENPTATWLDAVGADAVPFLADLLAKASVAEWKRNLAECLSVVCSDAALTPLFGQLDDKQIGPFAVEAAQRWPKRALRLLAPLAAGRGKAADPPRALAEKLVRMHAATIDAWTASLPADARALVASLRADAGPTVRDAREDELPPILRSPPWRQKVERADARVVEVKPLAVADAMGWAEGERDTWSKTRGSPWYAWQHKGLTGDALWKAELARLTAAKTDKRFDPAFLADAPADVARPFLPRWTESRWHAVGWIQALVAKFELEALPQLVELADEKPADGYEGFLPFAAPSLAPKIADALFRLKTVRPSARRWLLRHPEVAAIGLLPTAIGPSGKPREAAEHAIRFLVAEGHEATVRAVAQRYGTDAVGALDDVLSFDALLLFPKKLPKMPEAFWSPATLPKPLLRGGQAALPETAIQTLGEMLSFSTFDAPYAGLDQVKDACDPASLARFSWALFQSWLQAGAASKEQWAFVAMGFLGDDDCARRLASLVREWPGEAAHARAVVGLDVLAAIGTDVSLMHLNRIAEKLKFKGLQDKAREKIAAIAESRGMTQDELADRLVPDLGLDADGSMTLDYGTRTFRVGFDEQLRPFVRDAEGAKIGDLPKPGKSDDADRAKEAKETWQALKKDAKTAASTQVIRLELAMCKQRRFAPDVFQALFVEHPLLVHVVRRLVWATFHADGDKLLDTFRVAEDRTLANAEDDAWELPTDVLVGIPHPLELTDDISARWGQVLADYELLQPFAQIGRDVHLPDAAEKTGKVVTRVETRKVKTGTVLGLEPRGWRRGPALDAGVVGWMIKPIGDGLEARLDLDPGLFTGMLSESPEQTLGKLYVSKAGGWGWADRDAVSLSTLSPIVFSEMVRDVLALEPA